MVQVFRRFQVDLVIIGKYLKVWYVVKEGVASSDMLLILQEGP